MNTAREPQTPRLGGRRGGNILGFCLVEFQLQPSPPLVFAKHVIEWFFAAKQMRIYEYELALGSPRSEDLEGHRSFCSALIAFGEFASGFAKENSKAREALAAFEVPAESIEAETRLLRNNLKMFHDGSMSNKEADAVLDEVFGEA